jgi:hypothetical protein
MAIRFLSGQTIDGTLSVTGNVQAATFNTLPIETARNNNANRIVRTNVHGYVDFGWINTTSGNHTGSITRITASNDAYLRYVTPAQFRTGVTDGFYAPASTVSGVTSVATGNGLIGGTITSTGTLTMSGDYTGIFTVHEGQVWDPTTQGTAKGSIHIDPDEGTDHAGGALTFGASDASSGSNSQAGIYIRSDGSYGTKMYLATTDSYATGSKTALNIDHSGNVNITRGFLQVSNGNISLSGTGRIQGVDTVSASTDAANKAYVDAHPGSGGTVTSVATGNGLTGGTITTTGTLSMSGSYTGNYAITGGLSVQGNNIFGMGISTGSWYGDLGSHGYTRETGLAMTGGSEFVVLSKSGQGSVLVDGAYLAYESANGFFGSYNSSYGNLTGIQATGANTIAVKQLDGGTANLTITENLQVTGAMYQDVSSIGGYIVKPKGADFFTASPTQTGAIEIRFPTGGATRNDMVFFTVDVYQYTTNRSFSVKAGGYIYQGIGSNTWVNVFAQVYAKNSNQNYTVRFGDNGSTHCMWIGESTDSWSYSQVVVRDFFGGYATDIDDYKTGWDITFDSLSGKTINNTLTNNFPLAQDIISGAYLPLSGGTMSGNIQMLSNSLQFDQTGTRSWNISPGSGNLNITSGDSVGMVSLNTGLIVSDQITAIGTIYLKDRITLPASGLSSVSGSPAYAIFQEGGAWTHPYPDLRIAMHTGIKFGANASYNGMRFYDDYTMATQVMSVNNSSDGLGGGNVFVNNSLQAGSSLRAPIFYDSNDTNYYVDPASMSQMGYIDFNGIVTGTISGAAQVGRNHAYDTLELKGYGAELMIGAQHTEININYRTCNNNTSGHTPTTWKWRAGTSSNWSDHYMGLIQSSSSMRAPIYYDSINTAYYVQPRNVSNLNGLTVAGTITGTIASSNKLAITGYQTNGQSFYQTSGSFAGYSGWANYYIGNHGDGSNYYNTTIIFPFWGPPKYSRRENNTLRGPYNFLTNEVDQTIGVYLQSTTSLRAPIFYDYNNTAFYIDPSTTGTSVNVAGDVVAYASSDIRFKNNVTPITNALDKLSKIGGYTFEWNEISHKETGKKDIGVIAQEVEEILPEIVQTRSNGYKAVDYQKLTALLIESVKEQQFIIDDLKSRIERLEKI